MKHVQSGRDIYVDDVCSLASHVFHPGVTLCKELGFETSQYLEGVTVREKSFRHIAEVWEEKTSYSSHIKSVDELKGNHTQPIVNSTYVIQPATSSLMHPFR